jgi:hypothetical protein
VKLEGRQGKFYESKLRAVTQMGKMVCGNEESVSGATPAEQFKFETCRTGHERATCSLTFKKVKTKLHGKYVMK